MLNKFVDKGLLERLDHVATSDFARVTYTEAVEILLAGVKRPAHLRVPRRWGIDLQTEHERFLTEEHFGRPTFVTDYPSGIKAFYMRMNDDGQAPSPPSTASCPVSARSSAAPSARSAWKCSSGRIAELDMDAEQYRTTWTCAVTVPASTRATGLGSSAS